jgi:hypothetical protein
LNLGFFCFAMTNSGAFVVNYYRQYTEKTTIVIYL